MPAYPTFLRQLLPLHLLPPAVVLVASCAFLTLTVAPLPAAAASTTGSGDAATEMRSPGAFDAIAVSGSFDVTVRQAASPAVSVTADDNLLPLIETVVEDSAKGRTLMIRFRRGESVRTRSPLRISVDAVSLQRLALAGSGDLKLEAFRTPKLDLAISGSSDAVLSGLDTEALAVRISGSGDVRGQGRAAQLRLSIAGSGDVDLAQMQADDVHVRIAGSGDASVLAQRSLDVGIAGSGDVRYSGNPAQVQSSVAGSGSVRKR